MALQKQRSEKVRETTALFAIVLCFMSPKTRVMLPKIYSYVAQNPKSCRPKFY